MYIYILYIMYYMYIYIGIFILCIFPGIPQWIISSTFLPFATHHPGWTPRAHTAAFGWHEPFSGESGEFGQYQI